jgi:hypothetical protein
MILRLRALGLAVAALLTAAGLAIIWSARLSADRYLYVSELGAEAEPTAQVFRLGLTSIAVSAALVAVCMPRLSPRGRLFSAIPAAAVLGVSALAFGVASQVTCTRYCPLPVGDAFTWQDLIHTVCAVIGFVGASFVMLQVATDTRFRRLARFSAAAAVSVAVIAGIGGLLSLLQFGTRFGGILELVATTIALLWLIGLAVLLSIDTWARASGRIADEPQLMPMPKPAVQADDEPGAHVAVGGRAG